MRRRVLLFLKKLNIQKFLRQMNITRRMAFSFLLLSLFPIIIICIISYISIFRDAEGTTYEYTRNISSQVFNSINYAFEKYINKFERLTHNSTILADIYNYTEDESYRNDAVKNRVQLAMASIVGKGEGIDSVKIITKLGDKFSYNAGIIADKDIDINKLSEATVNGDINWAISGSRSDLYNISGTETHIILFKRIKYGYDNDNTAFALMTINKKYIDDLCRKNVLNNNEFHHVIILTEDGFTVSHPVNTMALKTYDPDIFQKIKKYIHLDEPGKNSDHILKINSNGKQRLISHGIIKVNNWYVLNVFDTSRLLSDTTRIGRITFILGLSCIVAAMFFLLTVKNSINFPVVNMISQIEKVGSGDFNVQIVESGNKIKDEHAMLSQGFNDMTKRLKNLIDDYYNAEINEKRLEFLKKEAELNALQQQINPHFLNNILEAIFWTAQMKDFEDIGEMVSALGSFLRTSINNNEDFVTISNEVKNVENYIYLQKIRFSDSDKFAVKWEIDSEILDYKVIKLILQPFIENSIIHGISDIQKKGEIIIRCSKHENNIVFEIIDNGRGISSDNLKSLQKYIGSPNTVPYKNVGIKNVNQRIKLYFGSKYGVKIMSKVNTGTTIRISLPAIKDGTHIVPKTDRGLELHV